MRVALGARRWRLMRQFLTESVLLATIGGIVGLGIAYGGLMLLKAFIPENISQAREISMDLKVLGFTFLVSVITGLIFGLAPALQAARFNQTETLKEGGRDSATGSSGKRIRGLLVMAEVAVSLVLLIGAGLLINSFLRLRNVDPGFRADNLLTMKFVLPEPKYEEFERRTAFYSDLVQRVEGLAGVKSAAVTTNLPLYRQGNSIGISIEGQPAPAAGTGTDRRDADHQPRILRHDEHSVFERQAVYRSRHTHHSARRGDQRNDGAPLLARRRSDRQAHRRWENSSGRKTGFRWLAS